MKYRLVLVGAGAFGRVVHSWIKESPRFRELNQIEEIVFIDDNTPSVPVDASVIGTISGYEPLATDRIICTVGSPRSRKIVVEKLRNQGAKFISFIDDHAVIASNVEINDGVVVCPGVVVQPNTAIGEHVHIGSNCTVGHDTSIMGYTSLSPMVNLMSSIKIGEQVFLGGSSVIIPGIDIGDSAVVGAGSVVTRSVPVGVTVKGVPGRW